MSVVVDRDVITIRLTPDDLSLLRATLFESRTQSIFCTNNPNKSSPHTKKSLVLDAKYIGKASSSLVVQVIFATLYLMGS